MHIYYNHPLQFHYHSGQTIQVIQDYKNLSLLGYQVFLYGTYEDEEALAEIRSDIGSAPIQLLVQRGRTKWKRILLRWRFFMKMLKDRSPKIIVGRNYNKTREIVNFRWLMGPTTLIMERHEDAFPYLLKNQGQAKRDRERFRMLFDQIDAVVITSPAQMVLFKREFQMVPESIVLPNGVDVNQFRGAAPPAPSDQGPYVLTYVGQFTPWKNVELLFRALTYLDARFQLRLAGGKGDEGSHQWIDDQVRGYALQGRVDFRGFVSRKNLVKEVLDGSSVLLLPLGDNLESRYLTSPIKLFEYMATMIPVVAVDYPSVRLITGEDSVYLAPNDPLTFASTIQHAITDPARFARIAAMNRLAHCYSNSERAKRFDHYLKDLIQRKGRVKI